MNNEENTEIPVSGDQDGNKVDGTESLDSINIQNESAEETPSPTQIQQDERFDQLLTLSNHLNLEVSKISQIFKDRLSYDATKEEAFERLYRELEALKKNEAFERNRPLFTDLILLFDRIENYRQVNPENLSNNASVLSSISDELLEILFRQGISVIASSAKFDPTTQRALKLNITNQEDKNNYVSQVVRKGFRYFDNILRPEEVIVNKYTVQNPV
jgi:molecular chaperone GrpE